MPCLKDTSAVILAGGMGTRLREAVSDRPKVLAEINGRPFLAFLLDRLVDVGIKRVVLCTGYMSEMILDVFGDSYRNMSLFYSRERAPLGTGGALRLALPLIDSDPVLVMNGDSYCDANLKQFVDQHHAYNSKVTLLLVQIEDVSRYGSVDVDNAGRVISFWEKGNQSGTGMINAGIYMMGKNVIESIPSDRPVSLERDIFPKMIGNGLCASKHFGRFIDIGIPSDYYAASLFFANFS